MNQDLDNLKSKIKKTTGYLGCVHSVSEKGIDGFLDDVGRAYDNVEVRQKDDPESFYNDR